MEDWELKRGFRGQYKTVLELQDIKKPYVAVLEDASSVLGQDGIEALKEKRDTEPGGVGPCRHKYSDEELAYEKAVSLVKSCDEVIVERQKLDALLVDPENFTGFVDCNAFHDYEKRFVPIEKRITLKEPYALMFQELKVLREAIGREDIGVDDARSKAVLLAEAAGIKGAAIQNFKGSEALGIIMRCVNEEIDTLNLHMQFAHDKEDRDEIDRVIERFRVPIRNGLTLKPVEPVRVSFDAAVSAVVNGVADSVLQQTLSGDAAARLAHVQARDKLARLAAESPVLRDAIGQFLLAAEGELRDEGNFVIEHPAAEDEQAFEMKGAGGG